MAAWIAVEMEPRMASRMAEYLAAMKRSKRAAYLVARRIMVKMTVPSTAECLDVCTAVRMAIYLVTQTAAQCGGYFVTWAAMKT